MGEPAYRRVVIKVSGEALTGPEGYGIHQPTLDRIAADLVAARALGVSLGIVVGGGNICRGVEVSGKGVSRTTGDAMGMLATVMNALAFEAAVERAGAPARTLSALAMPAVCETYSRQRAIKHLDRGRIVLFAAGTGNPFFTTDTAAALRAIEINADVLLKATKVNGVYSDDPLRNPSALRYTHLTFDKVLTDKLNVMDATAIVMCRDNRLPLRVFNLNNPGDLTRIVRGEEVGTAVTFE